MDVRGMYTCSQQDPLGGGNDSSAIVLLERGGKTLYFDRSVDQEISDTVGRAYCAASDGSVALLQSADALILFSPNSKILIPFPVLASGIPLELGAPNSEPVTPRKWGGRSKKAGTPRQQTKNKLSSKSHKRSSSLTSCFHSDFSSESEETGRDSFQYLAPVYVSSRGKCIVCSDQIGDLWTTTLDNDGIAAKFRRLMGNADFAQLCNNDGPRFTHYQQPCWQFSEENGVLRHYSIRCSWPLAGDVLPPSLPAGFVVDVERGAVLICTVTTFSPISDPVTEYRHFIIPAEQLPKTPASLCCSLRRSSTGLMAIEVWPLGDLDSLLLFVVADHMPGVSLSPVPLGMRFAAVKARIPGYTPPERDLPPVLTFVADDSVIIAVHLGSGLAVIMLSSGLRIPLGRSAGPALGVCHLGPAPMMQAQLDYVLPSPIERDPSIAVIAKDQNVVRLLTLDALRFQFRLDRAPDAAQTVDSLVEIVLGSVSAATALPALILFLCQHAARLPPSHFSRDFSVESDSSRIFTAAAAAAFQELSTASNSTKRAGLSSFLLSLSSQVLPTGTQTASAHWLPVPLLRALSACPLTSESVSLLEQLLAPSMWPDESPSGLRRPGSTVALVKPSAARTSVDELRSLISVTPRRFYIEQGLLYGPNPEICHCARVLARQLRNGQYLPTSPEVEALRGWFKEATDWLRLGLPLDEPPHVGPVVLQYAALALSGLDSGLTMLEAGCVLAQFVPVVDIVAKSDALGALALTTVDSSARYVEACLSQRLPAPCDALEITCGDDTWSMATPSEWRALCLCIGYPSAPLAVNMASGALSSLSSVVADLGSLTRFLEMLPSVSLFTPRDAIQFGAGSEQAHCLHRLCLAAYAARESGSAVTYRQLLRCLFFAFFLLQRNSHALRPVQRQLDGTERVEWGDREPMIVSSAAASVIHITRALSALTLAQSYAEVLGLSADLLCAEWLWRLAAAHAQQVEPEYAGLVLGLFSGHVGLTDIISETAARLRVDVEPLDQAPLISRLPEYQALEEQLRPLYNWIKGGTCSYLPALPEPPSPDEPSLPVQLVVPESLDVTEIQAETETLQPAPLEEEPAQLRLDPPQLAPLAPQTPAKSSVQVLSPGQVPLSASRTETIQRQTQTDEHSSPPPPPPFHAPDQASTLMEPSAQMFLRSIPIVEEKQELPTPPPLLHEPSFLPPVPTMGAASEALTLMRTMLRLLMRETVPEPMLPTQSPRMLHLPTAGFIPRQTQSGPTVWGQAQTRWLQPPPQFELPQQPPSPPRMIMLPTQPAMSPSPRSLVLLQLPTRPQVPSPPLPPPQPLPTHYSPLTASLRFEPPSPPMPVLPPSPAAPPVQPKAPSPVPQFVPEPQPPIDQSPQPPPVQRTVRPARPYMCERAIATDSQSSPEPGPGPRVITLQRDIEPVAPPRAQEPQPQPQPQSDFSEHQTESSVDDGSTLRAAVKALQDMVRRINEADRRTDDLLARTHRPRAGEQGDTSAQDPVQHVETEHESDNQFYSQSGVLTEPEQSPSQQQDVDGCQWQYSDELPELKSNKVQTETVYGKHIFDMSRRELLRSLGGSVNGVITRNRARNILEDAMANATEPSLLEASISTLTVDIEPLLSQVSEVPTEDHDDSNFTLDYQRGLQRARQLGIAGIGRIAAAYGLSVDDLLDPSDSIIS